MHAFTRRIASSGYIMGLTTVHCILLTQTNLFVHGRRRIHVRVRRAFHYVVAGGHMEFAVSVEITANFLCIHSSLQ